MYYANLSGSSAASAYAIIDTPGTYDLTIYENNGSGRITGAAFQANPVPEPTTLTLAALGLLALLGFTRRRRK